MNANTPREPDASELPEPVIRSGKRQISIVWLVPVVAILIGGWLIYKAISEKGPEITITFNTAEGLEAGKTKIKCKDVEIGLVEEISLSKDLTQVIVKAQLVREADSFLSENSRFWVVRARVSASSVTGLGTVFSGAYIDIDPGAPGKPARHFAGLEDPPIVNDLGKGPPLHPGGGAEGIARYRLAGVLPAARGRPGGRIQHGPGRFECHLQGFHQGPLPGVRAQEHALLERERHRCKNGRAGHPGQHRVVRLDTGRRACLRRHRKLRSPHGAGRSGRRAFHAVPEPGSRPGKNLRHQTLLPPALHHLGPRPFPWSTGGIPGDPDRTCGRSQAGVRPKENDV